MNELVELLDELQKKAKADSILREKLLQTRKNPNPIHAFCEICHANGVSIYEMDLAMAGEEFYAEIKRSTNGGGENSPALEGEDDFYELFLAALENIWFFAKNVSIDECGKLHGQCLMNLRRACHVVDDTVKNFEAFLFWKHFILFQRDFFELWLKNWRHKIHIFSQK